jgi:hypothetical protein
MLYPCLLEFEAIQPNNPQPKTQKQSKANQPEKPEKLI